VIDPGVTLVLRVSFFAFGAVFGSFANVCIHRLPRGESVVRPRSRCPGCGHPIAALDNVPVLSWLVLRGRCRRCRRPISIRYPLVELTVALLFLLGAVLFGPSPSAVAFGLLSFAAVVLVATDLEARILPDEITLGVLAAGLLLAAARDAASLFRPGGAPLALSTSHLVESVGGAALGALLLLAVRKAYEWLRAAEGMGLGDVHMIAMIGAVGGAAGVLLTLLFASAAGALGGGAYLLARRARWASRFRASGRDPSAARAAAEREGLLVAGGIVKAAGPVWRDVPGAARVGAPYRSSGKAGRPLVAFLRLAERRSRLGAATESHRLMLEEGDHFFRVVSARAERLESGILVLVGRSDIPFGVFLAAGSLVAFATGRLCLAYLLGDPAVPGARLLP